MIKTNSYLNGLKRSNSYETVLWFLKDFVFRYKYYLTLIVVLGFSAASIQGAILFLINSMVTNSVVASKFHEIFTKFNLHIKLEWFVFFVIIIGLTISAFFAFIQAKFTLKLWRTYQILLTNNILNALHDAVMRGVDLDSNSIQSTPIPSVLKSTQRIGAFTRLVINSIFPLMRFIIFSIFVFHSQPKISFLVYFLALPVGAVILFFSAKKSSINDFQHEALGKESSNEFSQRIKSVFTKDKYEIDTRRDLTDSYIIIRLDKLLSSLITAERSRLLMSLMTIVILALVTIFGGLIENPAGVIQLLIYLVALIMAFSQLSNVLTIASHFGRFYPTINRYRLVYIWLTTAKSESSISNILPSSLYKQVTLSEDEEILE